MTPSAHPHILVIYGTRPEAIKMAPLVKALRRRKGSLDTTVCATAQHREMLDQVHELFGLEADIDLDLMRPAQGLNEFTSAALSALDRVLLEVEPDWLLVQGDTSTGLAATLAAFHRGVQVGHVEAGLRTDDLSRPFPEEANRRIIDLLAKALFAPTWQVRDRLLAEGTDPERVFLTGNTVVDALEQVRGQLGDLQESNEVLVTVHRRESFGAPLEAIFAALSQLAAAFPETRWIYPVHPNPNVRGPAHAQLGSIANLELHEPFDYLELLRRLATSRLVLTDSGGIQEEAPSFGTPVLVLREETERAEGVEAGVAELVGTDHERIVSTATRLLTDPAAHAAMSEAGNPYGDGLAAERIAGILAGEDWTSFVPSIRDLQKS